MRTFDFSIRSAKLHIRLPTVIVAVNLAQMAVRTPRVSRHANVERDGRVCQYTGEHVGRNGRMLDYVVPRDKGGKDTFENLVWAKRSRCRSRRLFAMCAILIGGISCHTDAD